MLEFKLNNPNYTIYHRAALGGLAATIQAWGTNQPEGIRTEVERNYIGLNWNDELTEQEALKRLLAASFKLTEDKLINLRGQFIGSDTAELRLAIHEGLCLTFLQHNKMRPGEKVPRYFQLKIEGEEKNEAVTYKAINSYAHQKAQGTGLLDEVKKGKGKPGKFPDIATIPQSVVPGAMSGKKALQAKADEAILLLYLMVGCVVFLLRPRTYKEKAQACIVVPDVNDLLDFADSMQSIASSSQKIQRSHTYLGRIVGGAEEAALCFLVDINADDIAATPGVSGCQAIAMGKVAWDKNQINRSISVKVRGTYQEMNVFRAAKQYLGRSKLIKTKDGRSFAIPVSPVPELVAANLAADRHWCAHFKSLVNEKKDFNQMRFATGGLSKMAHAIKDADDQAIIRAFHKAWEMTMGQLGERSRGKNLNFDRLIEVRREKIRNEILRAKTPDALAGWFLRFCADATKGAALGPIREDAERIRAFIFNPRYFARFQNLLLFALVSYASDESKTKTEGD